MNTTRKMSLMLMFLMMLNSSIITVEEVDTHQHTEQTTTINAMRPPQALKRDRRLRARTTQSKRDS